MTTVVFAMEWVPQYRVPFYQKLRERLGAENIDVRLIHGDPPPSRSRRSDHRTVPWAEYVPNRFWTVGGLELTGQPVWKRAMSADLVVLQQEAGLLLNYGALFRARVGGPKVALWGHGHNFNPHEASRKAEWSKASLTRFAHWVFAYTEQSAEVFETIGVDRGRMTVVQNTIDTSELIDPVGEPDTEVVALVKAVRERQARVGWMVSALDRWKRVPFLLDVLDAVRARVDNFEFFVLGSGTEIGLLERAARSRPWLHVMGATFGPDKAAIGEVAEITVHPGLAGLHVVETFATETPMVTAAISYHSHEVSYLRRDDNAVILDAEASADDFADAIGSLLSDDARLATLRDGCRRAADIYTIDGMVDRFATGIREVLGERSP